MKNPKQQADELISDFLEMMPDGIDKIGYKFRTQYEVAKCQAEYVAHTCRYSHKMNSKKWKFWLAVQEEIRLL